MWEVKRNKRKFAFQTWEHSPYFSLKVGAQAELMGVASSQYDMSVMDSSQTKTLGNMSQMISAWSHQSDSRISYTKTRKSIWYCGLVTGLNTKILYLVFLPEHRKPSKKTEMSPKELGAIHVWTTRVGVRAERLEQVPKVSTKIYDLPFLH